MNTKKTIGIVTYYRNHNYGTMLQAYALQRKIDELGYIAENIDFHSEKCYSSKELLQLRLRRIPVYLLNINKYSVLYKSQKFAHIRDEEFDSYFRKYVHIGNKAYYSTQELEAEPPIYDGYIVGSDQTWNPYVAGNPGAFYLTFVAVNTKKGSYAPSLAIASLNDNQKKFYKEHLSDFPFLSCRELNGSVMLSKAIGRSVKTVLDPTLLLDHSDWDAVSDGKKRNDSYILSYFLGDNKKHREFVNKLSNLTGYHVVSIPISYLDISNKDYEKAWVGPAGFISLIRNAKFVCTDSFHGMMFSINYNKDFFSFCKMKENIVESENSRLYSALDMFGLSNQLVTEDDTPDEKALNINYSPVNQLLLLKREESIQYLKNMLQHITR